MENFTAWIRNIVCFLCFFQVLLHLVPGESYRKYLNFFGSLILIFMVLGPIAAVLGKGDLLFRILRTESLKGAYSEMEMHMEGMEELKTGVVNEAFQTELKRQVKSILASYGLTVLHMEMEFGEDNRPEKVNVEVLRDGEGTEERIGELEAEIQDIYGIPKGQVGIFVQG